MRPRDNTPITAHTPLRSVRVTKHGTPAINADHQEIVGNIDRVMRILDARRRANWTTFELQIVLQACRRGPGWSAWRDDRDKLVERSHLSRFSETWPADVSDEWTSIFLGPFPAGRVGPILEHSRLAADPLGGQVASINAREVKQAAARVLEHWLNCTGPEHTAALAPPIFETLIGTRILSRQILDLGLSWPLPVADGFRALAPAREGRDDERRRPDGQ